MPKPILIFGYGNLSRGDDALGPLLLEHVEQHGDLSQIEILCDFQLQIEHALDLQNRALVLFVDASVACDQAYSFTKLSANKDILDRSGFIPSSKSEVLNYHISIDDKRFSQILMAYQSKMVQE